MQNPGAIYEVILEKKNSGMFSTLKFNTVFISYIPAWLLDSRRLSETETKVGNILLGVL